MNRLIFLLSILFLLGCQGSKKLSNQNLAYLYTPTLNFIFPDYRICNIQPDSTRIFFSIKPEELLFMKLSDSNAFQASVAITYVVLNNYESKTPVDSGSYFFNFFQEEDSTLVIRDHIEVFAPDSADYILQLTLTDLNRQQAVASFYTIDRTGLQPGQDFMLLDVYSNYPYLKDYLEPNDQVKILNTNAGQSLVYLRYFDKTFPLSKPPFSDEEQKSLSYIANEAQLIDLDKREPLQFDKPGIYHFQFDTLVKEGFTLFRFEEDFPRLTSAESLIESIRFMTTREEFDKILSSSNKKQAVDDFWLSMAGNRERARVLIKSYYSRVQYANIFFTSYFEGWKTDRGLIYIIFGPPSSVYRNDETEIWNYSQSFNYGPLNFTFDKIKNPFTSNDYQLRRSINYELPWYRAVDSWRDGRVVNDNY